MSDSLMRWVGRQNSILDQQRSDHPKKHKRRKKKQKTLRQWKQSEPDLSLLTRSDTIRFVQDEYEKLRSK